MHILKCECELVLLFALVSNLMLTKGGLEPYKLGLRILQMSGLQQGGNGNQSKTCTQKI